jgi:hypothetical protein
MNYVPNSNDSKQLSELLDKACSLIITLEGYIIDANSDYDDTPCAKQVHELFDEIDMLNFHPPTDVVELERADTEDYDVAYIKYVLAVKKSIDQATEEGILKDDSSEGYSYLSRESFIQRINTDPAFANQWSTNKI